MCVRVNVCVPMEVAFDERVYLFLGLGMKVLELMHRTTPIEPPHSICVCEMCMHQVEMKC